MAKPKNSLYKKTARTRRPTFETLESKCLLAVVINELHYDPDDSSERVEFIELYNPDAATVDLSNWRINRAVDYTFPVGASLGPDEYLVIAESAVDFQAKFGFAPFGEWEAGDRLSNSGEEIELLDATDTVVDGFEYQLGFPWPTVGELGSSIELINPSLDNSIGGAWRSAAGALNTSFVPAGSTWSYRKGLNSNPPANWNGIGFNFATDSEPWQSGQAVIGYGDGDDVTLLNDMRFNYTTIYLRHSFQIAGAVPDTLTLRLYVDDGAIIYLNGQEVARPHVTGGVKNYNSNAGTSHDAVWEEITLTGLSSLLTTGDNILAVHALNAGSTSSDFSFDAELIGNPQLTSPGAQNSVYSTNSAPFLADVEHSILQPQSGQEVVITASVADSDGIASVTLDYQLVEPGDYLAIEDPRYATNWTSQSMFDDGTNGDLVAGDGTYSATLAGSLQTHRRLVRYRITAADSLGASITAPYADDPQPNFAYYVYDATPAWDGAIQPGVTPTQIFSSELLDSINTYHLITTRADHEDAQYIPDSSRPGGYSGSEYLWDGALVYNGKVYDHIRYRARGGVWRYAMGKNMWKFDFNRGHDFFALDDYGNPYDVGWHKINLSAIIQQGNFWHRGEQGLFEGVGFKLFNLAGVEAPKTNYVHFRIVESADENGSDQYSGDFQGLYLAVEQLDGQFLEEHDLPDGNLYKMEGGLGPGGIGGELNNQGDYPEVTDYSDLIDFKTTYESGPQTAQWWDENLDLESYYSYRSIVEAIHHYDIGFGKNYFYYHNPETGKWSTVPWDLDLTWADKMFGDGNEPFRNRVLAINEFAQAYRNRMREVRDLLYNLDQGAAIVDEIASIVYTDGALSWVDADRAMWDYNPILTSGYVDPNKASHGRFYAGGPGVPARDDFAGMIQLVKDYIASRGDWIDDNILIDDGQLPSKPTITYTGLPEFSIDGLQFSTSDYSHPIRNGFGSMEWRIGEISNPNTANFDPNQPWIYEIDSVWESGELTTFGNTIDVESTAIVPGRTYRARVRMQDNLGHWSHWSDPVEFVAGEGAVPELAVTELHYHPNNPDLLDEDDQEFIEIHNYGSTVVNLTGVRIADFSNTGYTFGNGMSIGPGEYLIVARNPGVFTSIYGNGINLAPTGYGNANLSNGGETVKLLTASGMQILSFTYDDIAPWPETPDGAGPSLEIIDPLGDPNHPLNWRASALDGGSPGSSGNPFLLGDYDLSGAVEKGDLTVWGEQYGTTISPTGTGADGDGNGTINGNDFLIWQRTLGSGNHASLVQGVRTEEEEPFASDTQSLEEVAPIWATSQITTDADYAGDTTDSSSYTDLALAVYLSELPEEVSESEVTELQTEEPIAAVVAELPPLQWSDHEEVADALHATDADRDELSVLLDAYFDDFGELA